jgi:hypothetical protein
MQERLLARRTQTASDARSHLQVKRMCQSASELRCLIRIKVEDDQDLVTARRAMAECGYFLIGLRSEAPTRSLTVMELLGKLENGEG